MFQKRPCYCFFSLSLLRRLFATIIINFNNLPAFATHFSNVYNNSPVSTSKALYHAINLTHKQRRLYDEVR